MAEHAGLLRRHLGAMIDLPPDWAAKEIPPAALDGLVTSELSTTSAK
jgi:hypothetical protein